MASVPQPAPAKAEVAMGQSLATTAGAVPKEESPPESISARLSAEEIYRMIRETAYFKAEARHFSPGVELQDWLEAEKEVRERLQARSSA
jgi:Protein of unknown function (DUF2934)